MSDPTQAPPGTLQSFLADRDTPCPGCGYNLRGLPDSTCPECGIPIELSIANRDPLWSWHRLIACAWSSLVLLNTISLVSAVLTLGKFGSVSRLPTWIYVQYIAFGVLELAAVGIGSWCLIEMWRARSRPRNEGPWRRSLGRFLVFSVILATAHTLLYCLSWFVY